MPNFFNQKLLPSVKMLTKLFSKSLSPVGQGAGVIKDLRQEQELLDYWRYTPGQNIRIIIQHKEHKPICVLTE
jgi:hypothetical protein